VYDLLKIIGYTKANDEALFSEEELGDLPMIHIPKDDTVVDQVHVLTSTNISYKIDLGSKQTTLKSTDIFIELIFDVNQMT